MKIGIFTSVCEEDKQWFDQYLREIERLQIPFVVNLDRCSYETKQQFVLHPLCIGSTQQDDPAVEFNERHKQGIFDLLVKQGFDWAVAMDVDETWEKDFLAKLNFDPNDFDLADIRWVNLWNDKKHIRVDGVFGGGHRLNFYNLTKRWNWQFISEITNGAFAMNTALGEPVVAKLDITCIHHGMMTQELRRFHKERWDRIYGKVVEKNPYGFWEYANDILVKPEIINFDLCE